ncbi:MAG TPA: RNA pseudouridine synthase, partial [Nitrospirae bacterium]|nr:RNA pseudouridine synthase [Nitrospirota bacterium]
MTEQTLTVSVDDNGQRIDVYLSSKTSLSRSSVQELVSSGAVTVNGMAVKPSYRVRMEDRIQVIFPERETATLVAEPLPIEVIYRDEDLIVVNKPPGMVMYPAAGHSGGTLMNAIAWHADRLATVGAPVRP